MYNIIVIIILFLTPQQDSIWELKKEKNGIKVYTKTIPNTTRLEFRSEIILNNVHHQAVVNQLLAVEMCPEIYPECSQATCLKRFSPTHDYHRIILDFPWPLQDRDAIYEQKASTNKTKDTTIIELKPIPNYIPVEENYVRLKKGEGFWTIITIDNTTTKVIYQFQPYAGKGIPDWIVNSTIEKHPYKALNNLKNLFK